MKNISRALVGTVAAGAMAVTAVAPAQAQSRNYRDRDRGGISAGEIIAGALVIGGIAAIASSASRNDRRGGRWDNRYQDPRSAIEQCVYAAERTASRHSWGGRAKVTDVRNVNNIRDGYRIKGRIAINTMGHEWRRGDPRYGRGWGGDYRGWNDRYAGYDAGSFTCDVRLGRIDRLNYSGIRGL